MLKVAHLEYSLLTLDGALLQVHVPDLLRHYSGDGLSYRKRWCVVSHRGCYYRGLSYRLKEKKHHSGLLRKGMRWTVDVLKYSWKKSIFSFF